LYMSSMMKHGFTISGIGELISSSCSGSPPYPTKILRVNLSNSSDTWVKSGSRQWDLYGYDFGFNRYGYYKPIILKPTSSDYINIDGHAYSARNYTSNGSSGLNNFGHPDSGGLGQWPLLKHAPAFWQEGDKIRRYDPQNGIIVSDSNNRFEAVLHHTSTGSNANDHELRLFLNESGLNHSKTIVIDSVQEQEGWQSEYGRPPHHFYVIKVNEYGIYVMQFQWYYSSYYGVSETILPQGFTIAFFEYDSDGDDIGDFFDFFPMDSTQTSDSDGDGFGDNSLGQNGDDCVSQAGNSSVDLTGCPDDDGDGWSNGRDFFPVDATQWNDTDVDGYGDNLSGNRGDYCPSLFGNSNRNSTYGCPDSDYDGWADLEDAFVNQSSQWTDSDGDGFGDEFNGFQGDSCPEISGTSTVDRFGCLDSDDDGYSDQGDAFPHEPTQYSDRDLDGYGDNQSEGANNPDAFPGDTTQWSDSDGDGHGDNPNGNSADLFPNDSTRWQDSDLDGVANEDDAFDNDASQWNDTDGDGYGDNQNGNLPDRFPSDPNRWQDSDYDGVADEDDAFPDDATQDTDSDGDGYGDNAAGNRGDTFPNDPNEWDDTDADDVGNNQDAFPFDPSQTTDVDGDGFGDNPRGTGADKFPEDATQWSDIDGDGYGDNGEGTTPDAFIADPTQWSDVDGDGYGDNPTGRLADAFPNDPSQWEDLDGDGFGDNQSGNNPDPFLFDLDNDGYNDSIDPLPKLASPGDLDNDGVLDENDVFPEDYREWADADGDGEGDNADTDDDNDGWTDIVEVRQNTDPFSSSSQPVDGFEVIIPGTQVSLGAWDLIGIFGGVPVFIWIAIGFATRNGRTARYEEMLRGAESVDDLERISGMWEYSLMMRMLGPHQGIRLERLRADLEYEFLGHRRTSTLVDEYDQTGHVEKDLPGLEQAVAQGPMETEQSIHNDATGTVPAADTPAQRSDGEGYEWFTTDDGTNFYRTVGSGAEWVKFED